MLGYSGFYITYFQHFRAVYELGIYVLTIYLYLSVVGQVVILGELD